jgi:uncharacterized protein
MRKESNQPRLTIDTNNVVSGTITPGNYPDQLMHSWHAEDAFQWIQSPATFHELQVVLLRERFREKFRFRKVDITQLLHAIETGVEFVTPLPIADLPIHCRDKEDDKFLACALGGSCDFLITNDNDLLILNGEKALGNLKIISAEAYIIRRR